MRIVIWFEILFLSDETNLDVLSRSGFTRRIERYAAF